MAINYNKIITRNSLLAMDEEKIYELKELANRERSYVLKKYTVNNISEVLNQKAYDTAYVSAHYHHLNNDEKAILATNIVFDDNKFVHILSKGNFELSSLETFAKLVSYMTYKVNNNMIASDDDKRYLNTVDMYTKRLCNHFSKYIGNVDSTIIVNKLIEIVTLNNNLLNENKKNRIR